MGGFNAQMVVLKELDKRRIVTYSEYVGDKDSPQRPSDLGLISDIHTVFGVSDPVHIPALLAAVGDLDSQHYAVEQDEQTTFGDVTLVRVTVHTL